MPSYTLKELRKRLEDMTDTENDDHLGLDTKNQFLAEAATETVDTMISSGLSEKTTKNVTFSTTSGQTEYNMQSATYVPDLDFYKVSSIYVNEGSNQFRPLPKIKNIDIQTFRPPQSAIQVKLYYIPTAGTFKTTDGEWDDTAEFNGVNGWEEHLLCLAAEKVMRKKNDDYRQFRERRLELEERMRFMGSTDFSGPDRVVRRRNRLNQTWYPYNTQLSAWNIRGDKLELYYAYPWVP